MDKKIQAWTDMFSTGTKRLIARYGVYEVSLVAAAVILLLARFCRLGSTPPGLHSDEMTMLANSVCLRHTGVDLWGHGWGFSSGGPVNAYGYVIGTPFHYNAIYAAWLFIAGDSIVAARSMEVLISLVIVACTTGIAFNFLGRRAAIWALCLSAISPWTWSLSRVAFVHPEFCTMHMFIGLWLITRHLRRGGDPTTKELVGAGLLFGVGLFSPYSTIPTALVAILFTAYLVRRSRNRRPIGLYWGSLAASYIPLEIGLSKYTNERIGQMDIFKKLEGKSSLIDKVITFAHITWDRLVQHLSLDFLALNGDANIRQHSGWGGELSWPQLLLIALLPLFVWVVRKKIPDHRRYVELMCLACVGALGGLLTASMAGEQTHANRALAGAPFFVLGCVAIALLVSPMLKYLTVACVALGIVFSGYFLHDYFTKFPTRSEMRMTDQGPMLSDTNLAFQSDVRTAGELAQKTGDFAGFRAKLPAFMDKYGLLADVGMVYFEAAGSGRGCPGYGK